MITEQIVFVLERGGPVIYPLFVSSLMTVYIILFKLITLRKKRMLPAEAYLYWEQKLERMSVGQAPISKDLPPAPIHDALLTQAFMPFAHLFPLSRAVFKSSLQDNFRKIQNRLESNLTLLETLSNVGPLLGLLGTALGMLGVFADLERESENISSLGGHIAQALITTVAGLAIGILALAASNLLYRKVENLMLEAEEQVNRLALAYPGMQCLSIEE